jgi:hypothetical protein
MTPMIMIVRIGVKGSRSIGGKIARARETKKQKRCLWKAVVGLHLGQVHLAHRESRCKSMHDITKPCLQYLTTIVVLFLFLFYYLVTITYSSLPVVSCYLFFLSFLPQYGWLPCWGSWSGMKGKSDLNYIIKSKCKCRCKCKCNACMWYQYQKVLSEHY